MSAANLAIWRASPSGKEVPGGAGQGCVERIAGRFARAGGNAFGKVHINPARVRKLPGSMSTTRIPKRPQLVAQALVDGFQSELTLRIDRGEGKGAQSGGRTHRFEDGTDFFVRVILDHSGTLFSGVVDQNVDGACLFDHLLYRAGDRGRIGDIGPENFDSKIRFLGIRTDEAGALQISHRGKDQCPRRAISRAVYFSDSQ
jgi:hypothetical protein